LKKLFSLKEQGAGDGKMKTFAGENSLK